MNNIKKTLVLGTLATGLLFGTQAKASHKVEKGETLSIIANKYGKTLDEIIKWNPQVYNIDLIFPEQQININEGDSVNNTPTFEKEYVQQQYVKQPVQRPQKQVVQKQVVKQVYKNEVNNVSSSEQSAKEWIAYKESNNNYNARSATGKFIGKYQLTNTYLNGDYSPENQERTVEKYVKNRYGSWSKAKQFWEKNRFY